MTVPDAALPILRGLAPGDEADWRRLWAGYNRFYETEIPPETTAVTWRRLHEPGSGMFARVAVVGGSVAGFAQCVVHPCTWTVKSVCYLEDLFVDPDARAAGVGRALLEDLVALSREKDWGRLYWLTRRDNAAARGLYDHYVGADDFVRYRIRFM